MAETILAVDDDVDILDLLEISLHSDGFNVVTANNGASGIIATSCTLKQQAHNIAKTGVVLLDTDRRRDPNL